MIELALKLWLIIRSGPVINLLPNCLNAVRLFNFSRVIINVEFNDNLKCDVVGRVPRRCARSEV